MSGIAFLTSGLFTATNGFRAELLMLANSFTPPYIRKDDLAQKIALWKLIIGGGEVNTSQRR
jgi:hypothetical protein